MSVPRVELLFWRECPSWERALEQLRAAIEEAGLDPGKVEVIEVKTEADAGRLAFPGSPTIRIGGVDVDPAGAGQPPALNCRVYRRDDGRISPLPDPDSLRQALARSAAK
jgi:hypothetical protein